MKNKVVSAQEAIRLIRDRDTLVCSGFGVVGVPDELLLALQERFTSTASPRDLTLVFGGGPGDGKDQGLNRLAHEGLIQRAIGGHWALVPKLGQMALANQFEAYNLPLGVISHLYRDIAAGLPGNLTPVGLGTFVDPRLQGGKINSRTTEELVELTTLAGREMLFYKAPRPNVAFIRATVADTEGNLTLDREALSQDTLAIAMATKNAGGMVIAQVEYVAEAGSLPIKRVKVPGIFVDCVVVARPEYHQQTYGTAYSPALAGEIRVPLDSLAPMPLDERKVIARRAAFELLPNAIVNLGIGMPEGVANIAAEERLLPYMTLTAEPGVVGGVPGSGLNFGSSTNATAQLDMDQQVGGTDCKPATGEITYGLERLAMYLQGVDNVYNLTWTDGLTYGDVYHQNEVEQSTYNFEHSDAEFLFTAFGAHEKQAQHLMGEQLALPAYEQVLKAAHTFNLLDARGAISVTERAAYIGRIRNLARAVGKSYLDSRARLGFPMAPKAHADEVLAELAKAAEQQQKKAA